MAPASLDNQPPLPATQSWRPRDLQARKGAKCRQGGRAGDTKDPSCTWLCGWGQEGHAQGAGYGPQGSVDTGLRFSLKTGVSPLHS